MVDLTPLDALVRLAWLIGAVCFVIGLSRMNSPATARNGNLVSAGGMILAIGATVVYLLFRPSTGPFNVAGWAIIIAGVIVSILLHELGHAFAARMFKIGTHHIELTGLGGFENSS